MKKLCLAVTALILVLLPLAAMAAPITGSLTTDPVALNFGVVGNGSYSHANGGFVINWNITPISGGYHYHYDFYRENGATITASEVSHIIFQVSDGTTSADFFNDVPDYAGPATYNSSSQGNSNPNMPNSYWGIKFNDATDETINFYQVDFDSTRIPVLGNFYAKGGNTTSPVFGTAWNDYVNNKYIYVPDSVVVPIPGSLLFLGSGLLGLVGLRWKL
jgi:hypothetical protein